MLAVRPTTVTFWLLLSALPQLLPAQTAVTLTATPNPSRFGAPVTLRAVVTPSSSTGKVAFYDGVTILGTKTLSSGAATLSTIALPTGSRKLRAYYSGAMSAIVTQTVSAQPSAGFATAALSLSAANVIAVADFNNDGNADLATISSGAAFMDTFTLNILLGDGGGNFHTAFTTTLHAFPNILSGATGATADFNGDGIIDLAVPAGEGVSILLGKGDGTFQAPIGPGFPFPSSAVATGDFNGDGLADLVAASDTEGVYMMLGKGDGTFQPAVAYLSDPASPRGSQAVFLVVADFNGDGKADLAAANANSTILSILPGNGDGTFQTPTRITLTFQPIRLAVGDFNNDGSTDLVTDSAVVLLNKGDGTFQRPVPYGFPSPGAFGQQRVVVSDFNGDGITDIANSDYTGTVRMFLGKGDGTFIVPAGTLTPFSTSLMAADFNNDGKVDLIAAGAGLLLGTTVTVTPTAGTPQSTLQGTAFPTPLQVTVKDGATPLSGVTVTFAVHDQSSGTAATLSSTTAVTDANGMASVTASAASFFTGTYQVTATALGVTGSFSLTNLFGGTPTVASVYQTRQRAPFGTAFPLPLLVKLFDGVGAPIVGATITFTPPSSGATAILSSTTATTDGTGSARVTATAGNVAGNYNVVATYNGRSAFIPFVNLQPATVSLASSANPSIFGATLSLTAAVSNASPTGRVTFYDGLTVLGAKPVTGGTAILSGVLLPAGMHNLVADYRDDANLVEGTASLVETVRTVAAAALVAQNPLPLPATPSSVALADFNHDGKTDFAFAANISAPNPWWQVDLGGSANVDSVVVWNRTDCCGSRLSDYWVFVSNTPFLPNDTPDTLKNRAGTFASHQTTAPQPSAGIPVGGVSGRYVRVQLSHSDYLSLAEVQVFGAPSGPNLAAGKTATQSSTYQSAVAALAVDGNTDGNYSSGSVATTDLTTSNVSVVLGNGDGTFGAPVNYFAGLTSSASVAVGDFNADGIADLVVSGIVGSVSQPSLALSYLPGKGDGTFGPAVIFTAGTVNGASSSGPINVPAGTAGEVLVGDFNFDGKADVVVKYTSYGLICSGEIIGAGCTLTQIPSANLLAGNNDGTFFQPVNFNPGSPFVAADFNGDGKADVASVSGIVRLGGEGVTQPRTFSLGPGITGTSILAGDFNGDGKPDLAIGVASSGSTYVLLGNGDGNLQSPDRYAPGIVATQGDFNGDGAIDLVVTDSSGNLSGILYGNGDGTFRPGLTLQAGAPLAVADFNGDGRADILTAGPSGAVILLGAASGASTTTLTSVAGTPQVAAVGLPFTTPLQVRVVQNGNPVSGATVTFSAPTVGASAVLSSPTAVTNAQGVASVTATANNIAGSYTVTASVGSASTTFSLSNAIADPVNLAIGKIATQSSTLPGYPGAAASSAIDGNTNGGFYNGSVTATNQESSPWWQVDLGGPAMVNSVTIFNRTDCCGTRLGDYWVFISNTPFLATDTPVTLQNRAGTFASHQTTPPSPSTSINTGGAQGRYLRIQLTGIDYLSLAEVRVIGTGGGAASTNLAAGKLASQSSTLPGYPTAGASSAVDGNTDGGFYNGSVTATNQETSPWWQVDLGASAFVSSVTLWNRTDCCGSRLGDYWIFISDTPFAATDTPATLQNRAGTFAFHQTSAPAPSATIATVIHPCPPAALCADFLAQGRYLRIQLTGIDYLSLAEVQVFGTGGGPAPANVAQGKPASQSSTLAGYPGAAASSAVDGNTDGGFYNASVTATNQETNAWWQVDLGSSTAVSSVVIWNRTDCCGSRLNDYWVFVSDTPFQVNDTPATLQNRAGTFASHQTAAPSPSTTIPVNAPGRYVRVQLAGTNYLSLAEVQVYAQ